MKFLMVFLFISCSHQLVKGIDRDNAYIPLLNNKNIALVSNQSSLKDGKHLLDYLNDRKININKIFALEHGFRGKSSAGEKVASSKDKKSGIEIISLYGKKKSPSEEDLKNIDTVLFDIQDVGVRFFTYIASLGGILQACAISNCNVILLDRPNPNNYIAGPVNEFKNFLAPYPIPLVYGLTIGELAKMIIGEKWIKGSVSLKVIKMKNYNRQKDYALSNFPSPNLRSLKAIHNYPTLALFEPTIMSIGRGTYNPFELIGHPDLKEKYTFTPKRIEEMSKWPKHENQICYGRQVDIGKRLDLTYFVKYKHKFDNFVKNKKFLKLLVGSEYITKLLLNEKNIEKIEAAWKKDLKNYKEIRKKYLLY